MTALAYFQAAVQLQMAGKFSECVPLYRTAIEQAPNDPILYSNLGSALYCLRQFKEAEVAQRRAFRIAPRHPMMPCNLGVTLTALGRHQDAVKYFHKSLKLDGQYHIAMSNLSDVLNHLNRYEEAESYGRKCLALSPNNAEAHNNVGMALIAQGRIAEGVTALQQAIKFKPEMVTAHRNLGLALLLSGIDPLEGWREYDWRYAGMALRHHQKIWHGEDLGTGALLVWGDQGVGDEILSLGMLDSLLARGLRVVWECDPRLVNLFRRSYPQVTFVQREIPIPAPESSTPDIVAHIPALSLAQYLRIKPEQFHPHRWRYLITPDRERRGQMLERFNRPEGKLLVGISWHSANPSFLASKCTKLKQWAGILSTPDVRFVDLQYGNTETERAALEKRSNIVLEHVDGLDLRDDFDGTIALIEQCDLVITVSNTVAHMAGAVGVPTWVLVPGGVGRFWYWGIEKDTTPWYPSVEIIRQDGYRSWDSVLTKAAHRLLTLAKFDINSSTCHATTRSNSCPTLP